MTTPNRQYHNLGLVVAMGKNGEIGYKNNLIWRIREDLDFFKNTTMGSYMIMGRNTYNSMPKNLEGRKYIVLSRDNNFTLDQPKIVYHVIDEVLSRIEQEQNSKFFVVGGGMIYKTFLPYLSTMYITQIEDTFSLADTYFPQFNENEWTKITDNLKQSEEGINYRHTVLVKKR